MSLFKKTRRLATKLALLWAYLGGILLLVIVFLSTINAALFALNRFTVITFNQTLRGIVGYEEIVTLLIASSVMMFFPLCQLRNGHATVEIFSSLFPLFLKKVFHVISHVLFCFLAFFLALKTYQGMQESLADEVVSSILGLPQWPFYLPVILSLMLWGLSAALSIYQSSK